MLNKVIEYKCATHILVNYILKLATKKIQKMIEQINEWQTNNDKSFGGVWDTIKKDILTKQEN